VPPSLDPNLGLGFQFGAGGGTSLTFAAPPWQASLGAAMRQVPDISLVADPFTGVEIIQTDPAVGLSIGVIGGTSLSCPLFSGLMAIASQRAGRALGQAAPLLYGLPAGAILDVGAVTSSTNVAGVIDGVPYSPAALVLPENTAPFYSALYNSPFSTRWFVISFGTDTSLNTGPGWDNVTGLGVPAGLAFVNAIAQ
jgi:subtilase family serine protease